MVIKRSDPGSIETIYRVLSDGGVAIMLCDTIYGILGVSPQTDRRITAIKGRDSKKPLLSLISDVSWLERFTEMPIPGPLREYWPGPLTLIFPSREGGTVGLRVPEDVYLRELVERLDSPVNSTSVNREREPPMHKIHEIICHFEHLVDLIVDSGDSEDSLPSTILDLTAIPFKLVRSTHCLRNITHRQIITRYMARANIDHRINGSTHSAQGTLMPPGRPS